MRSPRSEVIQALTHAFLAGTWHMRSLMARGDTAVASGGAWLRELAFAVVQRWPEPPLHRAEHLSEFIAANAFFQDAWRRREIPRSAPRLLLFHRKMGPRRWPVRELDTVGDVASWLEVEAGALSWRAHQQQRVTGVVVNVKPNVARAEFDSLKALLHRCRLKGPLSQSTGPLGEFRAMLQGRISWVSRLSAARGAKLQREFDALPWNES